MSHLRRWNSLFIVIVLGICLMVFEYKLRNTHEKNNFVLTKTNIRPSTLYDSFASNCDVDRIHVNDTDVGHVIDSCQFPRVSQDRRLEENINLLRPIQLPLLDNYRNPCWYEELVPTWRSEYISRKQMFPKQASRSYSKMIPILAERQSRLKHPWRLRCLPLVYIIGVAKCGTTDLFDKLTTHPHITGGATKEPFYWDWGRWFTRPITNYLSLYDEAAEAIRNLTIPEIHSGKSVAYHPMVTIDASVQTLFDFGGVSSLRENMKSKEPKYIAADLIKNLTPQSDIKVIVIIRNPTKRLFSSYIFYNTVTIRRKRSAEEFHKLASHHVTVLKRCFRSQTLKACLYDRKINKVSKYVKVNAGIYFGYIKDWIKIFPSMKVIRTEDYEVNRSRIYKELVDYIGLAPFRSEKAESYNVTGIGPTQTFDMLNETKKMLDEFYRPFNEQLADLLGDKKYLFNDE